MRRVVVFAVFAFAAAFGSPERFALRALLPRVLGFQARALRAAPIAYRFTFPEPEHRWMQVEASFTGLGPDTLELRMSRSSPGRYSLHDFAKNVYDVHAFTAAGRELTAGRPDPYGWNVAGHGGAVRVRYKVYGDRIDGTYLAVDTTHAHINMPAVIMWARGLDDRPVTVTLEQPSGMQWHVASQLKPGGWPDGAPDALEYTAPNLQYLMDSPVEFGHGTTRTFAVNGSTFRFALHHTGKDAEVDGFVKDVEKIVRQEGAIFGEYPVYEPGSYTFIADYLPWASGDGMEHRNSTVITEGAAIAGARTDLLDTVAHEFFHCWNVERIRPKGLEPFDFERANLSGELWLAEGFTEYYAPLVMQRAQLEDLASTARTFGRQIETVSQRPGRLVRSAEEMSYMAPFADGGHTVDRTNWSNTFISYYTYGSAIALALDLTLRDRTDGRLSLDDFMRAMWRHYGKPGGSREGYVDHPYTAADAEATLGEVSDDRTFAHDFFARYVHGHDVADYARLLSRAGFALGKSHAGRAWLGDLHLESRSGARVAALVSPTWPIYAAGLDQDDELQQLGGRRINGDNDVAVELQRHKPGDTVRIVFVDRTGAPKTASVTLAEDPHVDVVPVETAALTPAQQTFRARWLGPRS